MAAIKFTEDTPLPPVTHKVRSVMDDMGITVAELQKRTGAPYRTLDEFIKRKTSGGFNTLYRISVALGTTMDELIDKSEPPPIKEVHRQEARDKQSANISWEDDISDDDFKAQKNAWKNNNRYNKCMTKYNNAVSDEAKVEILVGFFENLVVADVEKFREIAMKGIFKDFFGLCKDLKKNDDVASISHRLKNLDGREKVEKELWSFAKIMESAGFEKEANTLFEALS